MKIPFLLEVGNFRSYHPETIEQGLAFYLFNVNIRFLKKYMPAHTSMMYSTEHLLLNLF